MSEPGDVFPRRELPKRAEDWGRHIEERLVAAERLAGSLKTNLGGVATAVGAAQGVVAEVNKEILVQNAQPNAPSNLAVVSNIGSWLKGGQAVSTVTMGWDPVAMDSAGRPINVTSYELWGTTTGSNTKVLATSTETSAAVQLPPGSITDFFVRARSEKGVVSGPSATVTVTAAQPSALTPQAPTGLLIQLNEGAFAPDNSAIARVEIIWSPVTQSTGGTQVTITEYEVWQGTASSTGAPLGTVNTTSFGASFPSSQTIWLRVRALSDIGAWGDLSTPIAITPATPPQVTTPPSAPVVSTSYGIVAAYWDGLLNDGTTPVGFRNVLVEFALQDPPLVEGDPYGPIVWTRETQPLNAKGTAIIKARKGQKANVRFYATDQLSRVSNVSATAVIDVVGVNGPDMEFNSIGTNQLIAGSVTTSILEAGIGGKLDITANDAVQIIVGQQAETSNQIAEVNDNVIAIGDTASTAAGAAANAQASADSAADAAAAAADAADKAQTDIAKQQTVYQFTSTGARIQTPGGEQALVLSPSRISLQKAGVTLTYWEGNQMVVPQIVTPAANLGSHRWTTFSSGRSIIQPLTS